MPIGIQRLNAKKTQPNPQIVFIKPLKGPDEAIAQDFLERIAAQCVPIMREHTMSVMSLEEYEPNREFVGRNFNNGEVIQLVLKSRSGRWLPFNYVQMVMMHELAHCKQMNHSRAFWAVRNRYADEMRQLWSQGYTGEGLWGRGALLTTGEFETNTVQDGEVLPEHLCGGTYRSRRRKRKAKDQPTYQQRKERRILKKFGANGVALGEDEAIKAELEKGKRTQAKPRVAGSKRGRELRAAAALARFGQQAKAEEDDVKQESKIKDEDLTASEDESETASEGEDGKSDATDINGKRLVDGKGHRMVKVCEDEDPGDGDAQNELRELQSSMNASRSGAPPATSSTSTTKAIKLESDASISLQNLPSSSKATKPVVKQENNTRVRLQDLPTLSKATKSASSQPVISARGNDNETAGKREAETAAGRTKHDEKQNSSSNASEARGSIPLGSTTGEIDAASRSTQATSICPMCSTENGPVCLTCAVCSHVLDGRKDPRAWRCQSTSCRDSQYLNAGDTRLCGVCGQRKPE